MAELICSKCGKNIIEVKESNGGTHLGAYCKICGAWIKWLKKDALKNDVNLRAQLKAAEAYSAPELHHNQGFTDVNDLFKSGYEAECIGHSVAKPENNFNVAPVNTNGAPIRFISYGCVDLALSTGQYQRIKGDAMVVIDNGIVSVYSLNGNELISQNKI